MKKIRFDFNNMLKQNIGKDHGVDNKELSNVKQQAEEAHKHLRSLIEDRENRINLGLQWTQLPYQDKDKIDKIQKLADNISKKHENVIFLGIGGSYLGLKAAQDALASCYYNDFKGQRNKRPRIYFEGNNLDPNTLSALLANLNARKTFVVVVSKSGETTETKAALKVAEQWLKKNVGKNYAHQIFAITSPDSGGLRERADKIHEKNPEAFRTLKLLKGVGGRFSEFNMGLLHLGLIGVKIKEVLEGARAMDKRCAKASIYKNPAYMYAVLNAIAYKNKDKDIAVIMPFSQKLKSTADWYVQLLAESLGKKYERRIKTDSKGKEIWTDSRNKEVCVGRTPISSKGTGDLHSIQQNNIEGENNKTITFIKIDKFNSDIRINQEKDILFGKKYSELLNLAHEATEWALTKAKRPNCTIILPELNTYHWGGLLYFFEMATAFEGELYNINAFNQPGVESYKNYMYYKLGKSDLPKNIISEIKKNRFKKRKEFIL